MTTIKQIKVSKTIKNIISCARGCKKAGFRLAEFDKYLERFPELNPQLQAIIAWRKKYLN